MNDHIKREREILWKHVQNLKSYQEDYNFILKLVNDYLNIQDKLLIQYKSLPIFLDDHMLGDEQANDHLKWVTESMILASTTKLSRLIDLLDRCITLPYSDWKDDES